MNDTDYASAIGNVDDIGGRAEWLFRDFLNEFNQDSRDQFGGELSFEDYVFYCLESLEERLTGVEKEMCMRVKWCVGLQRDDIRLASSSDEDEDEDDCD